MNKKSEQKINHWVGEKREALIEELKEFLRIPNLTGHEGVRKLYETIKQGLSQK